MNPIQNQAPRALANVLHDQGLPNRLTGIALPLAPGRLRLRLSVIVVGVAGLVTLLVLLAGRVP